MKQTNKKKVHSKGDFPPCPSFSFFHTTLTLKHVLSNYYKTKNKDLSSNEKRLHNLVSPSHHLQNTRQHKAQLSWATQL